MSTLKIWSWNVNGLRASLKKGFLDAIEKEKPDMIGIQETKLQEGQIVAHGPAEREDGDGAVLA